MRQAGRRRTGPVNRVPTHPSVGKLGEQRKRLLARIQDPRKNRKFTLDDMHERRSWGEYMKAYEELLGATRTAHCPWYIVPADDKRNARLIISSIIHEQLGALGMQYPKIDAKQRQALQRIHRMLRT
jgi:Polyphosphate kinase 2 (PPK2)